MSSTSETEVEKFFREAATSLSMRDLYNADVQAREVLARAPGHAGAQNLLGIIAARLGLFDAAERYFRDALAADASFQPAVGNIEKLATARANTAPDAAPGERFLLIKSWHAGFWSDVSNVLGAIFLAEMTNREPIIHWGAKIGRAHV